MAAENYESFQPDLQRLSGFNWMVSVHDSLAVFNDRAGHKRARKIRRSISSNGLDKVPTTLLEAYRAAVVPYIFWRSKDYPLEM
jgi:hypothetical protein